MPYTNINITVNTGLSFEPNDFVRLVYDDAITTTTTTSTTTAAPTTSTTTTTTTVLFQEYVIDNAASGSSSSACSGSTTTTLVYALPANNTPIVGMILYTNTALTTPFVGSTGWRKLVKDSISYAAEVDANGELTNYVTCP
jgi:hypothetical protein